MTKAQLLAAIADLPDDCEVYIQPLPDFGFESIGFLGNGGDLFTIIHASCCEDSSYTSNNGKYQNLPAFATLEMDCMWWADPKQLEEYENQYGRNEKIREYLETYKNEVTQWRELHNIT